MFDPTILLRQIFNLSLENGDEYEEEDLSPGSESRLKRSGGLCFVKVAEPLKKMLMTMIVLIVTLVTSDHCDSEAC